MADVNYTNPEAIRPQYPATPPGVLTGMWAVNDRQRYENMAGLQDQMNRMAAQKQEEELIQGAPVRAAERAATIQDLPWKSRQIEENAKDTGLQNRFTEQTQDSKVNATNQANRTAYNASQMQELQQGLAIASSLSDVSGPTAVSQIQGKIQQLGINPDHPVLQAILKGDPTKVGANAKRVYSAINQHLDDYRRTLDNTDLKGRYGESEARIRGEYTVRAAAERTAYRNKTSIQLMKEAKTPEAAVTAAFSAVSDPESDARTQQMARDVVLKNWSIYERKVQKGEMPQIPGLPPVKPLVNPLGNQVQPGNVIHYDAQGNRIQ